MSDVFSRDEVIECVYKALRTPPLKSVFTDTMSFAISMVNDMTPAQQWIPCSERLPTTKDDYIITVKDKSLTWTDYVEWSADYHWWEYDDDMVIAWMPLPEPYKGEEE